VTRLPQSSVSQKEVASRLSVLEREVIECDLCPRLVEWRRRVAAEKRASFRDEEYWGKAVPGFGDPTARLLIIGLAPAAHGANRTGRMFTCEHYGVVPDMLVIGKGLGGGVFPLAALIAREVAILFMWPCD